jgi:hypothetical protein
MDQLANRYVVKKGLWYHAKIQPTHPHRDANYTLNIEKATWFKEKPDLDKWSFVDDEDVEIVIIEMFYRIKN